MRLSKNRVDLADSICSLGFHGKRVIALGLCNFKPDRKAVSMRWSQYFMAWYWGV